MPFRTARSFPAKLAGTLLLSCVSAATPLIAQEPPATEQASVPPTEDASLTAEEALVLDGKAYAERFGVSLEEAMRRVTIMAGTSEQIEAIQQEFNQELSGAYFDNSNNFGLVLRLTGAEARQQRRLERRAIKRDARQERRDARRSERQAVRAVDRQGWRITDAELAQAEQVIGSDVSTTVRFVPNARSTRRAALRAIERNGRQIKELLPASQSTGYDEKTGEIVVAVVGTENSVAEATRSQLATLLGVPTRVEYLAKPVGPTAARGGTALQNASGGARCTAGFIGYDSSNRLGIITAGYCEKLAPGTFTYVDTDGKRYNLITDTSSVVYDSKRDFLFLRFPTGLTGLPQFIGNKGESPRSLTGRRTLASTEAKITDGTPQGSWICFYGVTSSPTYGQGCGEVYWKYIDYTHPTASPGTGPSYYATIIGPTTGLRCGPGDSGGPVFAWQTAFGVVTACSENSYNAGKDSVLYYSSTDAAYAAGYRLAY